MTPAQLEDLRRFANEGFPAVGRLLDAYESAQAELAAVRGGVVRGGVVLEDLTETEIEAVWARVRTYDYQHRSMAQRFVDELNEEIRTRLRSAPEGKVLVERELIQSAIGALRTSVPMEFLNAEMKRGHVDTERDLSNALSPSQRPGQGGKGGEG